VPQNTSKETRSEIRERDIQRNEAAEMIDWHDGSVSSPGHCLFTNETFVMRVQTLWKRVTTNLSDPDMRAKVLALAGGKAIGLILLLTAMKIYLAPAVFAQAPAASGPSPEVNAINTAWTLVAAFLVFGMQVGFVMLEAGFARSRESINILVEGIVDTCICGVTFWAWG